MSRAVRQLTGGGARERRAAPAPLLSHAAPGAGVARAAPEAQRASSATRRALFVLPLASAVFAVSALWSPTDLPGVVLCPFRALTGLPCPGCGMTRAFCALGHGDLAGAFGYNALAPFVFAAAVLAWAHALATVLKLDAARAALERLRPTQRAAALMLAVTLAWWVVRLSARL
ncbi:MAG TPA: DUF2752 domain-containing protein [Pyrinomonadaceae bacterium]|jgi:hypothetical protein|nr:DUF2752 domain-containing protein [Pyrinomonadaceae bacterium]